MQNDIYERLQATLQHQGPSVAVEQLCTALREEKDYANLFYALLMKRRQELGVSPVPTEPAQALPPEAHAPYEDGIRDAARAVGQLYLDQGDIPHAWLYFRMIGEVAPVAAALEKHQPSEGEEGQQVIEIAFHHGVAPQRGFDWILQRYGICSAITTAGSHDFSAAPEARIYCIQRLVRALHGELLDRLRTDIERREGTPPDGTTVRDLIGGRDWMFEDEFYHVDVSHLSSVVQMSIHLPPCPELRLACELCEYGERLSPRFQYAGEPPFENQYRDYGRYLSVLAGDKVEEGLEHFRAKVANADPENDGSLPAEVLVNLLVRAGRLEEALAVARQHLAGVRDRTLSCPGIAELCQRTRNYQALAEVAREQGDPVHFLAGLLAAK